MSEIERIADQLERSRAGGAWHGPALAELLADVDAREAAARPLAGAHTIWELVLHLAVWTEVARLRMAGGERGEVGEERSWPPIAGTSAADWERARRDLEAAQAELLAAVRGLAPERLGEPVPGTGPDLADMLHGVAQHNAYHGGQIALLKRALRGAGGAEAV